MQKCSKNENDVETTKLTHDTEIDAGERESEDTKCSVKNLSNHWCFLIIIIM